MTNETNPMETAGLISTLAGMAGRKYRYAWKSGANKTPRHLRFGESGQISYMRDGILMTTDHSGSYTRLKEFYGDNRDEHEVELNIACDVFDGDTQLIPVSE